MKVYISKYRNHWISPYTILKAVCFWEKDRDRIYNLDDDPNNPYEKWSNFLLPICQVIQRVLDFIHPKINYVKIDRWDVWNMDHTLAMITLPMLKQLKESKQGAPLVDDEDVPDELKSTSAPPRENEWDTDANHFKRWDWVMDEMIFAFECKLDDSWEDKFRSGEIDFKSKKTEKEYPDPTSGKKTYLYELVEGPNHTYKCDYEGMALVQKRIDNGFRLFGKYYQGLWD